MALEPKSSKALSAFQCPCVAGLTLGPLVQSGVTRWYSDQLIGREEFPKTAPAPPAPRTLENKGPPCSGKAPQPHPWHYLTQPFSPSGIPGRGLLSRSLNNNNNTVESLPGS